jgi:hypothetical protein
MTREEAALVANVEIPLAVDETNRTITTEIQRREKTVGQIT